jgi:YVTN family beta-propeller protein
MNKPSPKEFLRVGFALLLGIAGLPRGVQANPGSHADQDAFDAEVAALLPRAPKAFHALAIAPTNRIKLGDWSAVIAWTPHIPVSAATLPDGRVLTYASNQRTSFPSGPEFTYAATWNPATGQFVEYNNPQHDMFCGALVMLPDGRVLVNGGRNTTVRGSIFDWRVNTWTRLPDMNDPRWYNTSVALPSGRVWTVSGSGGSGTAERWDQASGWIRLTGIDWNTVLADPGYINIWHPFLLLAPDGRLIHFGPTDTMHWVVPDGSGSLTAAGTTVPGTHYPKEGAWVMYDEGRIVVAGGGADTVNNASDTTTGTSTTKAYTVDVRGATPVVTPANPMQFARQFANDVVLPNGEVMVIGGNTSGLKFNDTGSILTPEIWNPTTGQWRIAADASVPRNYHSLALLLPDGRVLSGGGGLGGGDHQDAQLYTPPTLYNADGSLATRPALSTAPASIGVATKFTVTGTAGLRRFSFIKMSAITHCVNTDLRLLSLPFTETLPGNYELTAHSSLNVMTPGYWMLFGLNAAGTHSVAKIILVDAINAVAISSPGNQAAYISQPASLQMIASAPAGAILNWSATGLPTGLSINSTSGLISGRPTVQGNYSVRVNLTDGHTSDFKDFTWSIQPGTFSQNFADFTGASGLTINGNAAIVGSVLRAAPNLANQVGSAFLTSPNSIGPDTSLSTRFVFRISGSADGADGLTFMIQGNAATALGSAGGGLGYAGISRSVAVEIDNYQGPGDPNANHLGILLNGDAVNHVATAIPSWDLEDGQSHTVWVEYDGPANQLRVYAAQGNVAQRPATPMMTANIDLPATVGNQAWIGFSAGTGGLMNDHDIESWNLSLNAFALPAPPVITAPGDQNTVAGAAVNLQMQANDPNGDLITWSASGLPTGLSISPTTGLITGTPNTPGLFSPTIAATDGNTPPTSVTFNWMINNLLSVQPLSGVAAPAGTSVALTAQSSGGLNPQYRWSFGDGTPDTVFSSSPSTSHLFSAPGRYLVTVTVHDNSGREVTASYRQAVFAAATARKPTASSSILYEPRTSANARLWVVNRDNDSVSVFDAVTRAKLAEINLGQAPRTLALSASGTVWVANTESETITILRPDYSVASTVPLPRGSKPFGVVFDPTGANAYVALEQGGKVLKLNPANGSTVASVNVGLHVRHLSVTADGSQILASRFVTPRVPGEETASPQTTVNGIKYGGEVLTIDAASFTVSSVVTLEHSEQPDTSNSAHGIPNYLGAAVVSPDGLSAWVPSKQDNIKRGTLRNGGVLTHDMAMRSIASRIVMATHLEDVAGRVDFDNAGVASAAAFDPNGNFLFTALEGSREVAVADVWSKQEILRFDAGRAPQGVALSPDGRTLFVHNFMDRTITVHDLTALVNGAETAPPAPQVLNCVTTEKLSASVLRGKQFFYDTRDTRVAFQQYISCAGCHNDGGHDGRVWDFTQFGEGLRNTITLRGHGGTAQGPLHWTGNFDEVQDFEGQIRNFSGTGLMSDTDFHAGTRSQPLGDSKAGLSADLDDLAAYVSSLSAQGKSPYRNADGTPTSQAIAGQAAFQQQNCAQCHSGSQFTDSALNVFHNIGTLKASSGQRLGAPLTGLDTPTLLGLWATAPYLHDGSAATLEEAINAHNGITVTGSDLSNLVAFLQQLDDAGVPAPPATVSWNNPAAITYGTALGSGQLNATANVPGTFAYTPPAGTILNAGNAQTLSVTFTPQDLSSHTPATVTVSLNVLRAPLTITAQNKNKIYGAAVPALTASYSGFVNGDTTTSLDSPVTLSTAANAASNVGSYSIVASGAADANYTVNYVSGSLNVTPAALTIRADDKSKIAGQPNPPLTATYTGFVNGDAPGSLDSPVALSTTATASSPVGSYPITASGASDLNYTITHVNGTLTVTPNNIIPAPWQNADIGATGLAGSATYSSGAFTINGSGDDIWNNADAFQFVYQPWTGDGEIIALVNAVGNTDPWAKAGVMFRQSLTAGSPQAMMVITPGNGAAFQRRLATDGVSTHTAGALVTAPYWVRLVRSGNTLTGYASADGVTWATAGSDTIAFPSTIYVGLAVTAHNSALLCSSTLSGVVVRVPSAPPGAPTGLSAAAASSTEIDLTWAPGSGTTAGYIVERSPNNTTFTQIATVGGSTTSYSNAGLSANTTYYYRIKGTNGAGSSPYSTVASATTLPVPIKINFQKASTAVPAGYLADTGAAYGNRGNGYSYGWNKKNTSSAYDRNSSLSPDQRYDTLIALQSSGGGSVWEIAVPNGAYSIFAVAGDPTAFDSVFRLNFEGVLTVSGTPTSSSRWVSGTKTVTVSDGRLTLNNGAGASNNKICFVDITPIPPGGALQGNAFSPLGGIGGGSLELRFLSYSGGRINFDIRGASSESCAMETSEDLQTWTPTQFVRNSDGSVSIQCDTTSSTRFFRTALTR